MGCIFQTFVFTSISKCSDCLLLKLQCYLLARLQLFALFYAATRCQYTLVKITYPFQKSSSGNWDLACKRAAVIHFYHYWDSLTEAQKLNSSTNHFFLSYINSSNNLLVRQRFLFKLWNSLNVDTNKSARGMWAIYPPRAVVMGDHPSDSPHCCLELLIIWSLTNSFYSANFTTFSWRLKLI